LKVNLLLERNTYFKCIISVCNPRYDAWLRP